MRKHVAPAVRIAFARVSDLPGFPDTERMNPSSKLSRRESLAVGVSSLAIPLAYSKGAEKLTIRKSLKDRMIKGADSIEEKFNLAKQAGFDGIEFSGPIPKDDITRIREASQSTGLVIPGLTAARYWWRLRTTR